MSKQSIKETMQQALDMFEKGGLNCEQEEFVAQSLRQAIADCEQAEKQEPFAWTQKLHVVGISISLKKTVYHTKALYTHPSNVRRLSDDEIDVSIGCTIPKYQNEITVDDLRRLASAIMDACNIPKEGKNE